MPVAGWLAGRVVPIGAQLGEHQLDVDRDEGTLFGERGRLLPIRGEVSILSTSI